MEFFLPSLAALLLAALIIFLVLPRLGAPVLAVLSIALLVYGVYNHYSLFATEYRYSTWQDVLKYYAPFVMVGGLIVLVLFYLGYLFTSKGVNVLPETNLPVVPSITNSVTNTVNSTANAITNTTNSAVNAIANAVGIPTKNNNKNVGVLTNLGNILATPMNRRNNGKLF